MTIDESVPIMRRNPRFDESNPINNKINNDFLVRLLILKPDTLQGNLLHTVTAKVKNRKKQAAELTVLTKLQS